MRPKLSVAEAGKVLTVVNPAKESSYDLGFPQAIHQWPVGAVNRKRANQCRMKKMLENLRAMADEIVALEVKELGSPEFFARATHCNYQLARIESYIKIAQRLELESEYAESLVIREPVGVVACITPWNYPLCQVVQKVIPAILMGNTVILKPS